MNEDVRKSARIDYFSTTGVPNSLSGRAAITAVTKIKPVLVGISRNIVTV